MKKNNSEVRDKALELFMSGKGPAEIARELEIPEATVRCWKRRYSWTREKPKRKKGGQPGNKNALGSKGGTGRPNVHGIFSKYADKETLEIMGTVTEKEPLDLMWDTIMIQYSAIIRSMRIMHVTDKDDKTKEVIGSSDIGESYMVQEAWDKQANYLKALARAIDSLRCNVKDYLELEGQSKADAKANAQDWKTAIIEIAKRRGKGHG